MSKAADVLKVLEAAKSGMPGLSGWHQHAGGTGAAPNKYGYTYKDEDGSDWHLDPVSTKYGKHKGYQLKVFRFRPEDSWKWVKDTGELYSEPYTAGVFSSPQQAVKVARYLQSTKNKEK